MKKVLSLLFAVILMATLIPTAFAEEIVDLEGGEEQEYITGTTEDGRVTYAIVGMIDGELSSEVMLYQDADCASALCPINEYGELLFVVELDVGGDGEKVLAVYTMDGILVGYVKMRYIAPLTDLTLLDVLVPYGALVGFGGAPQGGSLPAGTGDDILDTTSGSNNDNTGSDSRPVVTPAPTPAPTPTPTPAPTVGITLYASHGSDKFTKDPDYISGFMGFEISFDEDLVFSYSDGTYSYLLKLEYSVSVDGGPAVTYIRYGFEWPGVLNGCEEGELDGTKYPNYGGTNYLDELEADKHVRSTETISNTRNKELFDLLIANANGDNESVSVTLTGTLYKDTTIADALADEDGKKGVGSFTTDEIVFEGGVPKHWVEGEEDGELVLEEVDGQFTIIYPVDNDEDGGEGE